MKALPIDNHVTSSDRLGLTLFFAVVIHMIIILGVTFNPFDDKDKDTQFPTMDVTLVNAIDKEHPDDPDYLAQISQKGGGNRTEKVRATRTPQVVGDHNIPGTNEVTALPNPPAGRQQPELLTENNARPSIAAAPQGKPSTPREMTAAQLIMRSKEIASLTAEIDESLQAQAKQPRERFISASTQEVRDAAYMESWRNKVERIGNLNYPEEAKRHHLSGSLILDVAIRQDGTVDRITVRRSSGHKLLDDAAVRIVKLAAPFSPLPPEIRKDTDILHITKTWQFLSGNQLHM
jgi:protein TonB